MISGEKILITGVRGAVGLPLALHLALENEVWGIARFAEEPPPADGEPAPSSSAGLEAAGIVTRAIDLGAANFDELPADFSYVLHLAWQRAQLSELEDALRTNVEGAGLLLQHCRKARAALVMSGMGIYSGRDDPWHAYTETDPIGRGRPPTRPPAPRRSSVSRPSPASVRGPSTCPSSSLASTPYGHPGLVSRPPHRRGTRRRDDVRSPRPQPPQPDPRRRHEGPARAPPRCGGYAGADHQLVR